MNTRFRNHLTLSRSISVLLLLAIYSPSSFADEYETAWFSEESGVEQCEFGYAVKGIQCEGKYCDNKKLFCERLEAQPSGKAKWSKRFSEERNGEAHSTSEFVMGIACDGRYCDNLTLYLMKFNGVSPTKCSQTPFFSEERPSFGVCPADMFVAGIQCKGKYCDNLSLNCCYAGR